MATPLIALQPSANITSFFSADSSEGELDRIFPDTHPNPLYENSVGNEDLSQNDTQITHESIAISHHISLKLVRLTINFLIEFDTFWHDQRESITIHYITLLDIYGELDDDIAEVKKSYRPFTDEELITRNFFLNELVNKPKRNCHASVDKRIKNLFGFEIIKQTKKIENQIENTTRLINDVVKNKNFPYAISLPLIDRDYTINNQFEKNYIHFQLEDLLIKFKTLTREIRDISLAYLILSKTYSIRDISTPYLLNTIYKFIENPYTENFLLSDFRTVNN